MKARRSVKNAKPVFAEENGFLFPVVTDHPHGYA
jgi:hypothetical protein